MKTSRIIQAFACTLLTAVCATPALAQSFLAGLQSGVTFEAGAFAYGRDRYEGDTEIRVSAALGWRAQRGDWFLEPHLRWLAGPDGWGMGDGDCDGLACNPGANEGTVTQEVPAFWPGLMVGTTFGDETFAHGLALRLGAGVGDVLQPLAGLRYEASARRIAWFVEASLDRAPWATWQLEGGTSRLGDDGARWMPGISAGGRLWLRPITTHAPKRPGDAGIIPPQPAARKD